MEDNLLNLLNIIPKVETGTRFILGIDGLSRSGKTTLVKKLSQMLQEENIPVCVFHMDDHIVERKKRYKTGNDEWFEYYNLQWDVEWLKESLFKNLSISKHLNLPFYENESDTHRMQDIILPDTCVIIIEGVFLQRRQWRDFFDYVAYLDCPRNKRFLRESDFTQENIEKFRNRYWIAEDYYIKTEVPTKQANSVLKA